MLKKLLDGLIFGTGFGIAILTIWLLVSYFVLPNLIENRFEITEIPETSEPSENVVLVAPSIRISEKFLGSPAVYSANFLDNKAGVLSRGDGIISGKALVNEQPLSGLKLRLALNGSVMSQWATTDSRGIYRVRVPFGEYKIDGYEFDHSIVNKVLPNKIKHPENSYRTEKFLVSTEQEGRGIQFRFVDPLTRNLDKRKYSLGDKIILKWNEYPEANEYTVQVYEKSEANSWKTIRLFNWSEMPKVSKTELELNDYDLVLKPGYFYTFEVQARDSRGNLLSATYKEHFGFDFEISK